MAVAAIAVSACAPNVRPVPPGAAVAPPAAWRDVPYGPTVQVAVEWWRQLDDPRLATLVARALANNVDVLSAVARVEEAEALTRQARSARLPSLDAGGGAGVDRALSATTGRGERSVFAQPQLNAAWTVDLFGRIRNLEAAARANYIASQADREATRLAVTSATVQAYVSLLSLAAQRDVARDTLASRAEALRVARDRTSVGYSSQFELTQAQAEYEAVAQALPQLELALRVQENALRRLTGDVPGPVEQGSLGALRLPAMPAALPSSLLRRRPDIAAAEQRLVAADRTIGARRAEFLPDVQLSASAGGLFVNALDFDPVGIWSLGASILAPLFAGRRLTADLDAATAQRDQAAFAYRGTVLTALEEVENALTGQQRLSEQEAIAERRRAVLERSLTLARDRYRAGYADYLVELDAQRNLYQANLDVIDAREQQLNTLVRLWAALGGGWEASALDRR